MRHKTTLGLLLSSALVLASELTADNPAPAQVDKDETLKSVAASINNFAFDFHKRLAKTPAPRGNLAWSPYSFAMALGMCREGAAGDTFSEMSKVLHYGPESKARELGDLMRSMEASRDVSFRCANGLWFSPKFPLNHEFQKTMESDFLARIRNADFSKDADSLCQEINGWVEEVTQKRIKDLLPGNALSPNTTSVLVNAVSFIGQWANPFDPKQTASLPFHTDGQLEAMIPNLGERVDEVSYAIPMMQKKDMKARYGKVEGWEALELPFKGEALAFVALLPAKNTFLESEQKLDATLWTRLMQSMKQEDSVDVRMPKFKLETTIDPYSNKEILSSLGMPDAFVGDAADFSRLTATRGVSIGSIHHKAFIEVKEEGAEAAAATAVEHLWQGESINLAFEADRPFFWAIVHKPSGAILFMGRLADPR